MLKRTIRRYKQNIFALLVYHNLANMSINLDYQKRCKLTAHTFFFILRLQQIRLQKPHKQFE